jgi:putative component of membrane protein insertase Oxa1/YidC/SpoIIIJ protein YidD
MNQSQYAEILKEYKKQKGLEEYQQHRVLVVPNTTYKHVVLWVVLGFLIDLGFYIISQLFILSSTMKSIIVLVLILIFSELYLRFLGIKVVECYQHYAKEETRRRCLCVPSCSEYAILCFKKYFFIYAIMKIYKRLFKTCKGENYKIDWP